MWVEQYFALCTPTHIPGNIFIIEEVCLKELEQVFSEPYRLQYAKFYR